MKIFEKISGKIKLPKIPKKLKKFIIPAIVLVLVIVSIVVVNAVKARKQNAQVVVNEAKAMKMDITSSITGAATIEPKDMYSVTSLVTGDVISDTFEEGDIVNEGDVLYQIDAEDIEKNIRSANISLERSQNSYNDALKTVNDLSVKAQVSGIISKMNVKKGDNVSNGMAIADVYDNSSMQIKIPFNEADAMQLYAGQSATLSVVGSGTELYGTVTEVNNASETKNGYMQVRYVTIRVDAPGALTPTDKATANIGNIYCNDAGTFEYITETSITAKASGTVKEIIINEGNYVSTGQVVLVLESESAQTSLRNARLSLEEAQISLNKVLDSRDNYEITAPISGTVVTKNVKAGDKMDNSNSLTEMAVIYDMSSLNFDLNVDELDISKISVGQDVKITADALEGRVYNGKVTNVSINGTQSNGVTTYPVSVEITEFDDRLIPGMNIDAEIVVQSVSDVLAVPVSAVTRGNNVYVKGEKESEEDRAPEGYKTVQVQTGVYNDDYIEITSGLKEGDTIWIQSVASGNRFGMPGMMGGRMGGGMPSGGMGGGMPSGGGSRAGGGGMPGGR